jgi:phosphohistidine phosphatase SixA
MTSLLVVRHAIAEQRDARRWPDDAERPLTPDGEARFGRAARGLRPIVPHVDLVLSSSHTRAWRTGELLHEEAGWPPPERCEPLEGERPPSEAAKAIHGQTAHQGTVAVVGHEPQLSGLVSLLLTGDADAFDLDLKKGGAVRLDLNEGRATLRWVATPKLLRASGKRQPDCRRY